MNVKRRILLASGLGLMLALSAGAAQAAPFAYFTNLTDNTLTVVDTATNAYVATIPVQAYPVGVAIKPDGSRVYVTNRDSDSVTVIDALGNSVITHIPVGDGPHGIAMKPDGTRVYVANWYSGTVSVINTATNTIVTNIAVGASAHGVAINPAGTRVYVTRRDFDQVCIIDTASNAVLGACLAVGDGPVTVAVNPAGTLLYVVNEYADSVTVINTATNGVVATVTVGDAPYGVVVNPTGTRVYVTSRNEDRVVVIDGTANTVIGSIPAGDHPTGLDINKAGTRLYAANHYSYTASVLNAANNTLITNVPVGRYPISLGRFIGPAPAPATTSRISLSSGGSQGLGSSFQAAISSNGRYLAFASEAPNLVGGDTNGASDIFVRDRVTKFTTRVSVASDGSQATGPSYNPAISADGRFVAFESEAPNLVAGDTNNAADIFVRDLWNKTTLRVSLGAAAAQANGASFDPAISADGRYVAFVSEATNLVAGDGNTALDVFVRDRTLGTTTRVSVSTAGVQGNKDSLHPAISGNGNFVAFSSFATNLVGGDTNNAFDIFVRDRTANTTTRVSIASGAAGAQGNKDSWQPFISTDGRYVVYSSEATTLVAGDSNGVADIFLRDRATNTTTRVSLDVSGGQADGPSYNPVVSADGRYVAFESYAQLEPIDTNGVPDIYLRDRTANQTTRLSIATSTVQGNWDSLRPAMSTDGRYVAFESFSSTLVGADTNSAWDIFVRDRGVGTSPPYPLGPALESAEAPEDLKDLDDE